MSGGGSTAEVSPEGGEGKGAQSRRTGLQIAQQRPT